MPRPQRCRRICAEPEYGSFAPEGGILQSEAVELSLDEFETVRLIDLLRMTHEQCASEMLISRTTVTEIYERARQKLADSVVNGKRLVIGGGNVLFCEGGRDCGRHCAHKTTTTIRPKGEQIMRIAVTYENGNIFQHFGHTEFFKLYDIEGGKVVASEVVSTNGSGHGALAGFLQANGADILICGGIGGGAQAALANADIKLFGGVQGSADAAVEALLAENLAYNPNVQCNHHDHDHHHDHACGNHGCGSHSCH